MAVWDTSPSEFAARILERLRTRYEAAGYTFDSAPDSKRLPPEFGSYIPDAVAIRDGQHIAIEIKSARRPSASIAPLQTIRDIVERQPGWKFSVVYAGTDNAEGVGIAAPDLKSIAKRVEEIEKLGKAGFLRPAFVMTWPLLEAVAQSEGGSKDIRPLKPGTVVQSLEMDGHVSASDGARLRELVKLRNQIIHGNLEAEPSQSDIEFMLAVIRSVVSIL